MLITNERSARIASRFRDPQECRGYEIGSAAFSANPAGKVVKTGRKKRIREEILELFPLWKRTRILVMNLATTFPVPARSEKQRGGKTRKTNRPLIHGGQAGAVHHRGRESSRAEAESARGSPLPSDAGPRLTRQPRAGDKSAKFTAFPVPSDAR